MMPSLPILSIRVSDYGRPALLRRGLASIAESLGAGIEVVITDDLDTAQGRAIAKGGLTGWNYRYEHHERPLGMAQNWNQAIALATGQYVMILDDDDFLCRGQWIGWWRSYGNQAGGFADRHPVILCGALVMNDQERVMKRQVFQFK